uniref:Peptidase S1 domain-containing protein n=1 Tax=Megaselia scalaris TaxID=36166 RepID=T1H240_MEGSC
MKSIIAIIFLACVTLAFASKIGPPKGRIVNGVEAKVGQAPYIVSISDDDGESYYHSCGGIIIDKEWILTAGHCLIESGKVRVFIYAGVTDNSNRTGGQERATDYAIIHPKYPNDGSSAPYDIALLHLEKPLEFNELVKPIALPYPAEFFSGKGKLYGWGRTDLNQPSPNILQTVESDILEYEECKL